MGFRSTIETQKSLQTGHFRNPWKFISQVLNLFLTHIAFKVGNGTKISFWKDSWKGNTYFAVLFPRLFRLTSHPLATIAETRSEDKNLGFWV